VSLHHRWFAVAWVLVLLVSGYVGGIYKKEVSNDFRVPRTDSQAAYDLLNQRFPSQNAATANVVISAPDGAPLTSGPRTATVDSLVAALEGVPGVASVSNPLSSSPDEVLQRVSGSLPPAEQAAAARLARAIPSPLSADGRVAVATVTFKEPLTTLLDRTPVSADTTASDYPNPYRDLQVAVDATTARATGEGSVAVAIGGPVADTWNQPVSWWANHADEVGLLLGAVLLLVAFGSLFGMVIPIVTALFGAVTASGLVYLLASVMEVSAAAPAVTLMISIGVGLDYSLLIVTRYRQFLAEGHEPHDAAGLAMATSGKAALFAGLTVCVALLGLLLVPIPLVQTLGVSAAIGVITMVVAAGTLLPALLGFAGARIDRVTIGHRREESAAAEQTFWGRFAQRMSARPWIALGLGLVLLLALAAPFLRIQFGMPGDGSLPTSLSQQRAYAVSQKAFGPGTNGPLLVVVGLHEPESYAAAVERLAPVSAALGALKPAGTVPGVQAAVGPIPNDASRTSAVIYEVIPTTGPDAPATTDLVRELRTKLEVATRGTGTEAHVGGATATLIDLTDLVTHYLPYVIGAVVIGAFLLLMVVFRSILVPLKAAIMNLVSIAAAYGVVVMVFQWGWAKGAVGLSATIPIVSFVPLVMFVILFGLSMDYEVFLMSRIREEWDRTADPRRSVVLGVAGTARVITTAALIMMAVFLSFVANADPTVKLIGFGMAVAVLLDSTIVRMVLVPAVMELLGRRAWWFPGWLRWLPNLDVEGSAPDDASSLADERAPEPVA
jgi:RND superfamily putative drug exporter